MKKIKAKILSINQNILEIEPEEKIDDISKYEIIIQKKKRGLDANALAWTLIDRISAEIGQSRDEVYNTMLERYGVATYIVVKPNEADKILELMEHGRKLGDVLINGKKGTQLQIFIGSSNYNSEEFAIFLNGIISECQEMNLTIPDKDVFAKALLEWGK